MIGSIPKQLEQLEIEVPSITTAPADTMLLPLGLLPMSKYSDNPAFIKRLAMLSSEQLQRIKDRGIRMMRWSAEGAEERRLEFLRYISLRHITETPQEPNQLADEFWHVFLLFTREYQDFCGRHFGAFIHHEPTDNYDKSDVDASMLYEECYGRKDRSSLLQKRIQAIRPFASNMMEERQMEKSRADLIQNSLNEYQAFKDWGNWENSWKNWSNWKDWDQWSNFDKFCNW